MLRGYFWLTAYSTMGCRRSKLGLPHAVHASRPLSTPWSLSFSGAAASTATFFFFHSGPHPATELRDYSWLCARGSICSARDGSRVDCIKGKNLASTTNSLAPFYSFQVFKIYFGFWDYTGGGGWGLGVKPHSTEVALGNVQETLGYKGQTQVSCMKSMCPLTG